MKTKLMVLTALILFISMLLIPMQAAVAPVTQSVNLYVSEVKACIGETSEESAKELLTEGFSILSNSDGSYADLNYSTGTIRMTGTKTDIILKAYRACKETDRHRNKHSGLVVLADAFICLL